MLMRVYSPVEVGQRITVELKQGDPVEGTACWTKGDSVGVSFDAPIDIIELISASSEGPRPRMPRIEVQCMAWVREDGTVHRSQVVNVSQGGLRLTSSKPLTVGAEVVVTLIDLPPTPGVVRWNRDDSYGITFNRPLTLPTLVGWLRAQQDQRRAAR